MTIKTKGFIIHWISNISTYLFIKPWKSLQKKQSFILKGFYFFPIYVTIFRSCTRRNQEINMGKQRSIAKLFSFSSIKRFMSEKREWWKVRLCSQDSVLFMIFSWFKWLHFRHNSLYPRHRSSAEFVKAHVESVIDPHTRSLYWCYPLLLPPRWLTVYHGLKAPLYRSLRFPLQGYIQVP